MKKFIAAISAVLLFVGANKAVAANGVNVTAATGGSSISADTMGGTYTTLTGPKLVENNPGGMGTGTIILNAPTGFEFNAAANVTVALTFTGTGSDLTLANTTASVTTTTITITVTSKTTGSRLATMNFQGIQVRPSAGTPLASGTITKGGTASYSETGSVGNYGTLTETVGALRYLFTTLPGETFTSGSGNSGTVTTQTAGTAFNITRLTATDQFTNTVTTYTGAKTISYSGPGGSPTYTTSVTFSSGASTTTLATTLRLAETTTITATATSLTGMPSSPLTVSSGPANRLQILLPGETANPGSTTGKTGSPTAISAFTSISATVNLVDSSWNIIDSSDTIHFTSTDSQAVLPANTPLSAGTGAFSITLKTRTNTTITVSDVTTGTVSNNTSATITVTNNAPALTSINDLTGATEDTTFAISYATLLAQASVSDIDVNPTDSLSFRVQSISTGTLTQSGTNAVAGVTLLTSSSAPWVWRGATNANGTLAAFTVKAYDGSTVSTSTVQVNVAVTAVNDVPSFTKGANQTVLEDSGLKTVTGWATTLSTGPSDESAQTLSFLVSNNNTNLFSVQPAVSSTGTLTFTPATNANGSATVTVSVQDDGGTANGGVNTSGSQTFTVTVTGVNDTPSFTKGADVSVAEDSGANSIAGWATSISTGASDETSQTLTFTVNNNNNSLFSVQPAISSSGTLTFTPASNASGTATVTVTLKDNGGTANGGSDTSGSQTFSITVNGLNDAPSFTKGADQTVLEDSTARTVTGWATSISAGGGSTESSQTVSFVVSNNNNSLFSVQPVIASNGTLTFTPAADANGSATVSVYAQDDGGTANGGVDSSATQTFTITVTAVNDVPGFTKGADISVMESSGAQSFSNWATSISAGPSNESSQTLTFTVSNNNNSLFSVQPAVASNGTLTFTPAASTSGSATVTLSINDNGGVANGGVSTSASQTFTINVLDVNDAPTLNVISDVTILEDAGQQSVALTGISAGPNETSQEVTNFTAVSSNTNLISNVSVQHTSGASTATLRFTPVANANGSATITVTLEDDGGTAGSGVNVFSRTFNVTVTAVNDAPVFTKGSDQVVRTATGAQTVSNWATGINAGAADETAQTYSFHVSNNNNSMFLVQPSISTNGTLTFTPLNNGTATVSVYLQDNGGTTNSGVDTSATQTFTIAVYPVNLAPTFSMSTNVSILEDSGAQTISNWATSISAGAADEAGQTLSFVVTNNNNSLFSVQPSLSSNGVLTFTPAADAYGSADVTVILQDNGDTAYGGANTSVAQTFTLNITGINDAPSFTKGLDVALGLTSSRSQTIGAWATGISAGANELSQTLTFVVTNDAPSAFSQQPAVAADGTLTFTIASTTTNVLATVGVRLMDNGGTANGGIDSTDVQIFRISLSSSYGTPTTLPTGQGPTGLYLGNLRGLTFPGATKSGGPRYRDIIVANSLDNTISVRFCNDDGTFSADTTYSVGLNPFGVISADLNRDGFDEIIAANFGTNTLSVLLNNTDRTFSSAGTYTVGTSSNPGPIALAMNDFNGDGKIDIVVANYNDSSVSVLLGTGSRVLGNATNFNVGAGPMCVWTADFNGDKKIDIVTANKTANTLTILPGLGNGSFGTPQTITLFPGGNPQPTYVFAADLNSDSKADLVVANYGSNTVSVLLAQANNTFQISSNYTVGINPRSILVRDLDRNGMPDLAIANSGSSSVSILRNRGDGTFDYSGDFLVGTSPTIVWGSNFDGDDATDLAISNYGDNTISILRYSGPLAYNSQISLLEDHPVAITLNGQILNSGTLTYAVIASPTNGSLSGTGKNLTYTPATNFNGTDTFKYQVTYSVGDLIFDSSSATVTLKISPVNDAPSFSLRGNSIGVTNFNTLQTNLAFATSISAGPNETAQQVTFTVTTTNTTLFDVQPKISSNGNLTFRPAANKSGTAYLSVRLTDNGGTANSGTNGSASQTFTITVYPNPLITMKGAYNGLFYESTGVEIASAGFVNVNLTDKRTFTGKIMLAGKSYSMSGTFATNGIANLTVLRTALTPLSVKLNLDLLAANDQMTGTISDGTWTAVMRADRNIYATTNPTTLAGKYTMAFGGNPGNTNKPAGDGLGMIVLKPDGTVGWSGILADGTSISQAVPVSKNGIWPFYASLYSGNGLIMGWLTFTNTIDSNLEGDVSWIKSSIVGGKYYPRGFTNDIVAVGSTYVTPAAGTRVLNLTNAFVELRDGNLSRCLTNRITLSTNNIVTVSSNTNGLALTVTTSTGALAGSFVNPQTKARYSIKGIALQKQNAAYGFFLGTNQSGLFQLHQ